MVRCEFPFMEVQSLSDHRVVRATLQQSEPYYAIMPPNWANIRRGCVFRPCMGSAGHPTSSI